MTDMLSVFIIRRPSSIIFRKTRVRIYVVTRATIWATNVTDAQRRVVSLVILVTTTAVVWHHDVIVCIDDTRVSNRPDGSARVSVESDTADNVEIYNPSLAVSEIMK